MLEADLDRFYHRDLRDLWRFDAYGGRLLTSRMVFVRLRHGLPAESALAIDANGGRAPWSMTEHLLADLWAVQANQGGGRKPPKDHPGRPKPPSNQRVSAERAAKMRSARRRAQRSRGGS